MATTVGWTSRIDLWQYGCQIISQWFCVDTLIIGLSLIRCELAFIWTVDCPGLVSVTPVIGLVVNLLGVFSPVLRLFLLPLFCALSVLCSLGNLFLTLDSAFTLSLAFVIYGRRRFEILGNFKVVTVELLENGGKCANCSCFGYMKFQLLSLRRISYLLRLNVIRYYSLMLCPLLYWYIFVLM